MWKQQWVVRKRTEQIEESNFREEGVSTGGAEAAAESNILIAYFSRAGNVDFDENIDAVTSASVNMDAYDTVILIFPNW